MLTNLNFQNQWSFIRDITKTLWLTFFWDTVYIALHLAEILNEHRLQRPWYSLGITLNGFEFHEATSI